MDAARRRRCIFGAVLAMSLRGAMRRPLVFVFEDLHWVDTSTKAFLAALTDSIAATRILILATHRLGYSPPFGTRSFQTRMTLNPLSEAEALTMARRMLGVEGFPADVTRALLDKAEGVPLFVEEVTKTFLDLGILERENGGFRVVRLLGDAAVPNTMQDMIMARLDRLGEEGKRTVQLASVIGRQFLRRLLERIAGLTGELEGYLEQGLLPEPAYIFKHAVIQDVAYRSLLVQHRKELHQAVGRAIGVLYIVAEFEPAVAAYERALALLRRTGDRKQEVATEQVFATVNAALAIAIDIGDTGGQAGCYALRGGARASCMARSWRRFATRRTRSVLLAKPATRASSRSVSSPLVGISNGTANMRSPCDYLREGLELARREHSGYLIGLALYHLGHADLAGADYEGALKRYRSLLEYADAAGDMLYLARLPNLFGGVSLEVYDLAGAIRLNGEGEEAGRRFWPWPEPRGHSLWKLGLAHLYSGNHGRAERAFREAESLRELDSWGRWTWEISLWRSHGELALSEEKYDDAWTWASRSLEAATQCLQRKHATLALRLQGQILAAQGRLTDAARALAASLDQAPSERRASPGSGTPLSATCSRVSARTRRRRRNSPRPRTRSSRSPRSW
jgi:tetratricopeptide (TPR) repeat protein